MNRAAATGELALRHQEIAFSVSMGVVAVLGRDNPLFVFPELLFAFATLLAFNLAYHVLLRRRGELWYVPMISMAVNTLLISLVLAYSGGAESDFWPMYLLPIFTACLYLDSRHVAFACAASCAFLAYFYIEPLSEAPGWHSTELAIKLAVLGLSASVTARYAFQERRARKDLVSTRNELEGLATTIERAERQRVEHRGGLSRFLAGLVYDLNGRLTLIRGRAELLTGTLDPDSPQAHDARQIVESVRSLSRLGSDLLRVLRRGENDQSSCDLPSLLEQVLVLVEPQLRPRRLRLERAISNDLPEVRVSAPHLQQALLELFESAIESSRDQGVIGVSAETAGEQAHVRLRFEAADGAVPPSAAAQRRLIEPFGGDVQDLGLGRSCEYVVRLPLDAGAPHGRRNETREED